MAEPTGLVPHATWRRFWIYQQERFPVFKNGLLIASLASSAVCLSALLRGQNQFPSWFTFATAFIVLFFFFALLRIADEFKDAEVDANYRPERPVPRGLVTLPELAWLGLAMAVIQVGIAVAFHLPLTIILLAVWVYMALMTVEFFASDWLHRRPSLYMVSHMAIMPLIDFFATACDWLSEIGHPPDGLVWFLVLSFFNGIVIEVGRKTWAPSMEREGVESYSASWGLGKAVACWAGALLCSFLLALFVAYQIDFLAVVAVVLVSFLVVLFFVASRFLRVADETGARRIENLSGLWVFSNYLLLGVVPMAVKVWQ